jgi:hypothetical protein
MSDAELAGALARLNGHYTLHLPLRRRDVLGRLALRFLWKRHLKWQMEVNIATRDAVDNVHRTLTEIRREINEHASKLNPIVESIGIGTGFATNVGVNKELGKLREADQNVLAGLNQRIYAAVGGFRYELSDLRLALAEKQDNAEDLELRLKEIETEVAKLTTVARDLRLRGAHLDLVLDEVRSSTPEKPAPAVPDRGAFQELAIAALLDGPLEQVAIRRRAYLPVIEEARGEQPSGSVFDMAPAQGVWLEALRAAGVPAESASSNPYVVRHCATLGFELSEHDPLERLAGRDRRSLAAITAFRYVERLDPATMTRFVDLAATTLRPGGVLVVETPHAGGAAARDFHLDPFATRPVHPDYLRFLVEIAGFSRCEVRYVDDGPLAGWPTDPPASGTPVASMADRYCLIAWR